MADKHVDSFKSQIDWSSGKMVPGERTFHKARPTAAAARAKQKDESSSDGDDDVLMDDDRNPVEAWLRI
jgi:hypothetical protein